MSFARVIVLALASTLAAACANGPEELEVSSTQSAVWTVGPQYVGGVWDSGTTSGLSSWQEINCLEDGYAFGAQSTYLLNVATAWREKSSNLDNFVARLQVGCTNYVDVQLSHSMAPSGPTNDHLVYSGGYRSTTGSSTVSATTVPIGLRVATNPGGTYVKDISMLRGSWAKSLVTGMRYISGYGTPFLVGWALNYASYGNNTQDVMCPDQMALSGVSLRNDSSSGKIRILQIYCVELGDR